MLRITVDDRQLRTLLSRAPEQIPYAISRTLNYVAWESRQALAQSLGTYFVVRNRWTERGFRVAKAHKRRLRAYVGSTRPYMAAQVLGERRTEGRLVVPLVGVGRPRRELTARTTPSTWPRALLRRKNIFVGRAGLNWSRSGGVLGVWLRAPSPTKSKTAKKGLRLLWRIPESITIRPRYPMRDIVAATVQRHWPEAVVRAVDEALRTRR